MLRHALVLVVGLAAAGGCNRPAPVPGEEPASQPAAAAQWRPLFDGVSTSGWRGFKQAAAPPGWQVVDSALTWVGGGGDLMTEDQFGNFELELEWKVAPGGNSGILFRVTEEAQETYHTGPEMQVLDDAAHRDGLSRLTAAGSNYALHPAPEGVVRPAGEWNAVRLVVNGAHVEHWLNGVRMVEYELWTPAWDSLVAASKFVQWPGYGRARRGHIVLQDHGDTVAYRNIRIRELP
ncbi:MAG TPA: DUF1080 domain-containing protein [Gemmatimonadales bacterium]|nr:DUF1080 domain-containing protein [Gemmatimonadales bacterium]